MFARCRRIGHLNRRFIRSHHYFTLGLERNASMKEIKDRYIYLAKHYHPDVTTEDPEKAKTRWLEIQDAYSILSDPYKRERYDLSFNDPRPQGQRVNKEQTKASTWGLKDDEYQFGGPEGPNIDPRVFSQRKVRAEDAKWDNDEAWTTNIWPIYFVVFFVALGPVAVYIWVRRHTAQLEQMARSRDDPNREFAAEYAQIQFDDKAEQVSASSTQTPVQFTDRNLKRLEEKKIFYKPAQVDREQMFAEMKKIESERKSSFYG